MTTNPDDSKPAQRGGLLRFTVNRGNARVTAFMSEQVSRAHFGNASQGVDLIDLYRANQPVIDEAVLAKANAGGRQPVVLSAQDLEPLATDGPRRGTPAPRDD